MTPVAALFVRADSTYKQMPGVDAWDIERDARRWPGGCAVVAHPPCRAWGRLRTFAKPRDDEKQLARWAACQVRIWGGVLEHPVGSTLWAEQRLPAPGGGRDRFGGWTLAVDQHWWGHRAAKPTLLYIVGVSPAAIPALPISFDMPPRVVATRLRMNEPGRRPCITKPEREHTPPALAAWLVDLATRCRADFQQEAA